jgi:hemerythrin
LIANAAGMHSLRLFELRRTGATALDFLSWRFFVKNALYIVWQPANEIGIPIIDEQHRGVVSAINSLRYCIQSGNATTAYGSTMDLLNYYTRMHFQAEEQLMKEAGYPEVEEHMAHHVKLMEQFVAMTKKAANEDSADDLLVFLKEWWLNHINNEDREYAVCVKRFLGLP